MEYGIYADCERFDEIRMKKCALRHELDVFNGAWTGRRTLKLSDVVGSDAHPVGA